jgi:antagonist of KipI
MGGHQGRALRAGDVLPVTEKGVLGGKRSTAPFSKKGAVLLFPPWPLFQLPEGGARLRVIAGALADQLANKRFTISTQSDRMGYRLDGPSIATVGSAELISSAVPTGAIQIPPTGQPILLMADHATAGGYPIAATVISADLAVAGQLAPGDWIEFDACSLKEADEALRAREAAFTRSGA